MQTQAELTTLYNTDFYGWIQEQGALLRARKFDQLDLAHLIEEIESLGRQEQRELRNRLGILLGHLLKWHYQPKGRSKSWRATIREQRQEIRRHLKENPSLKPYLEEAITIGYEKGLHLVDRETPLDPQELPPSCPFSQIQIFEEPID
ncbi:DUF29 domain-containing protein [Candidatus Synechococcus calcipolaris G9]|uniref:DUF29 domain-containing protein n=1 Tax=Candidatus Synechococcus calcipolaris G9 TaxID=1497997 RepID=A0ABT6F1N1_9SYNE|nr:DUF29 domain-containing protein [Candidatus Synechococcus calcipolaris]MDG2991693.1 DUF29 domain-containing protein [Candidatus Synechococcus calcipolaris G9]